jgi:hypothetical protein
MAGFDRTLPPDYRSVVTNRTFSAPDGSAFASMSAILPDGDSPETAHSFGS